MGWHPSWYHCECCGAIYLLRHPITCACGNTIWTQILTEDMQQIIGWRQHPGPESECNETCQARRPEAVK